MAWNSGARTDVDRAARFEQIMLPHLASAYNVARWLMRNDHDAQDVVQEAYVRALRFFDDFRGGDARSWLLAIVRNTCFTLTHRQGRQRESSLRQEEGDPPASDDHDPQVALARWSDVLGVRAAIERLPADSREVIVLHEIEGLAYKEVARVIEAPIGTVMSRLSRARRRLRALLAERFPEEAAQAKAEEM